MNRTILKRFSLKINILHAKKWGLLFIQLLVYRVKQFYKKIFEKRKRDFCGQSICYLFGKLYEFSRQLITKWREVAKNGSDSLEVMFSVALFRSKQYSRFFFFHHFVTEGQIWCRIKTRFQYFNFGMCGFWEKLPRLSLCKCL